MKKGIIYILFLALIIPHISISQNIPRIDQSPYPFSAAPDTLYTTSEILTSSQKFTLQALQGLLAKTKPQIIRDDGSIWLSELQKKYNIVLNNTYYSDFTGLINHFKSRIKGYVLCDLMTSSSNVAISISNINNAIPVSVDLQSLMTNLGIPMLLDVRGKDANWTIANYGSQLSKNITSYQSDQDDRLTCLGDYSVFSNALQFWDAFNGTATTGAFSRMNESGVVMGYGPDEYGTVKSLSQHNLVMNPSDWAKNLSVLTNIPIASFTQKDAVDSFKIIPNVHTVCFVFTDGDNVQWLVGSPTNSNWFGNPNRNKVNLGWTISPALSELAPPAMKYYYDNAPNVTGGRSYFIAGASGRGYNYPGDFSTLDVEAALLNKYMKKADLNIVNILDEDNTLYPIAPFLKQDYIDALFYYKFSNYSGLNGKIWWYHDKPAIGGRYNLWYPGFETPKTLAQKLNASSTDIYSENGYSLIPVHAWSMTVDSVISSVNKLSPNVRVVAPDEFVYLIRKNLKKIPLGQGDGLTGQYFNGINFDTPRLNRIDKTIDFDWKTFSPAASINANQFSIRWSGKVQPVYSEKYTFHVSSEDGVRLWVNNRLLIDKWQTQAGSVYNDTITLTAGIKYAIKLEHYHTTGNASIKLTWESPSQILQVIPESQLFPDINIVTADLTNDFNNGLRVYPNPFLNKLRIEAESGGAGIEKVSLTSMDGKRVFERSYSLTGTLDIDLPYDIPGGIYVLAVQRSGTVCHFRIQKMN